MSEKANRSNQSSVDEGNPTNESADELQNNNRKKYNFRVKLDVKYDTKNKRKEKANTNKEHYQRKRKQILSDEKLYAAHKEKDKITSR